MLNQRFCNYFKETFFQENPMGFADFLLSIEQPILRTIRIKPGKEQIVRSRLEADGWILHPTSIDRIFQMDRRPDFDPFERRLGMTLDHLIGNFYIQEFAAAHPVNLLADGKIHDDRFLILDMASSPGGKTTQLVEHFPNSFIVANEPSRERIPQLLQNLERMHTPNIGVTLYPGQQWKHFGEIFDRILLDAPCSGEGTLYKGTDAVKNWHLKSIKQIAHLQKKLLTSALSALKAGGEMVYSTCALNDLENEGVLADIKAKYGDTIEIIFEKKFWPHIDKTGGFFMAKILKKSSFLDENLPNPRKSSNTEIKKFREKLSPFILLPGRTLFSHRNKILSVKNADIIEPFLDKMYFMRFGETIGFWEKWKFVPNARSFRDIDITNFPKICFQDEQSLDDYLRWRILTLDDEDVDFVLIEAMGETIALEKVTGWLIENSFPKDWRRR